MSRIRKTARTITWSCLACLCACTPLPPQTTCLESPLKPEQLLGTWRVSMSGQRAPWTLEMHAHPDHPGSLRGVLRQKDQVYSIVADLDDEEFTMEETQDGKRISATWVGTSQTKHCDHVITGERLAEGDALSQQFVIHLNRPR